MLFVCTYECVQEQFDFGFGNARYAVGMNRFVSLMHLVCWHVAVTLFNTES